jgi:hypothetical protein
MIVFVVGLYKSGTSLISSILEEIGCESIVDRVATTKGQKFIFKTQTFQKLLMILLIIILKTS